MIRIRFHGRGGHGVKTASRIVGTAAFLSGHHVQDSPIYGAERRGAPIAAFTRIDSKPILERGVIEHPHIVIVADETLLDEPLAGVQTGLDTASVLFVNTDNPDSVPDGIASGVQTDDITSRALSVIGHGAAISSGLAGAAAKLSGVVNAEQLQSAIEDELDELHVPADVIAKNVEIASQVFTAVEPVELVPVAETSANEVVRVPEQSAVAGTPSILHVGNAEMRKTGNWRIEEPAIDREICTRCGLCVVHCPDGAIALDDEGYPVIDYEHCKGCMICRTLCPPHGITSKRQVKAW